MYGIRPPQKITEIAVLVLTGFGREGGIPMARIPKDELERLKREVAVERLAEARGVKLERHGADLLRPVPLPRRPRAEPGDHAEQEPLALPRRLPGRRLGDRLGDAGRGRELPPRGRAAARRSPAGGAHDGEAAEALDGAEAAGPARCERRRPGAAAPRRRLLPRGLEGEPRGTRPTSRAAASSTPSWSIASSSASRTAPSATDCLRRTARRERRSASGCRR